MKTFPETLTLLKEAAQTLFKEQAMLCDRDNIFPEKNFAFIKENNLLALLIPKSHGGYGFNFHEYQECLQIIASACGSTASAFNMHNSIMGGLADILNLNSPIASKVAPFIEYIFSLVVKQQKVFASVSSEPSHGARVSKTRSTYVKCEGGYRLTGEKSFVTMANYADYYVVLANKYQDNDQNSNPNYLSYFIVDRFSPGITVIDSWDTLGMRGTQSHRVIFENVFIPNEHVFLGVLGFALDKMLNAPHWIIGGYLGVYLGIMKASLDFTVDYVKSRTNVNAKTGLGYEKLILSRLSDMYSLYQYAALSLEQACKLVLENPESPFARRAIYFAKHTIGESCMALTSLAIKTCGGSSISKNFDLERYFRDSRCCALMPAVSDVCELYIGRDLLNLPQENVW